MTRGNIVDLGEGISRAVRVAKSGDVDGLELELRRLQAIGQENVASVTMCLRGLARSVRSHPSFQSAATAQAG